MPKNPTLPRNYRGWTISFDYGFYTGISPDYDAELTSDGWEDNGLLVRERTFAELCTAIDDKLLDIAEAEFNRKEKRC